MTARAPRPRRQRLGDRLTATVDDVRLTAVDFAIAPFDRAMTQAEQRWGIDRLPELVSAETAAKWGKAIAELNQAILDNNADRVTQWVGVCLRGLPHLEAEAVASGAESVPPRALEWREDDRHFVVIEDARDWLVVQRLFPGATVYTLRDIAVMTAKREDILGPIKAHFPGAQIKAITPPPADELQDEILF